MNNQLYKYFLMGLLIVNLEGCASVQKSNTELPLNKAETADLTKLEEYLRTKAHEPVNSPLCSELEDFNEFTVCKSSLEGAPSVIPTHFAFYNLIAMVYEEDCPPPNHCKIEVNTRGVIKNFDYQGLKTLLQQELTGAGESISYSGYSSGEVFLVSKPRPSADAFPRQYYQIRLVARNCSGYIEWSDPCGFYGDASLIHITNASISAPGAAKFEKNALSLRLEAKMLDKINEAMDLKRRSGL